MILINSYIFSIKMAKQRKGDEEKWVFKDSWTGLYFFKKKNQFAWLAMNLLVWIENTI